MDSDKISNTDLPPAAIEYIDAVIKKMRYRKKIRADVRAELTAHFEDALRDCDTDDEKAKLTADLIAKFGEPKLLAKLIRRGKKRCRPLWQKAFIRFGQFVLILLLLIGLRIAHLGLGRPTISVDYVQWLNELGRQGRDEELNAEPYIRQAMELLGDKENRRKISDALDILYEHGQVPEDKQVLIEEILTTYAEVLDQLRKGAERPYYWVEYKRQPVPEAKGVLKAYLMAAGVLESIMPDLGRYKTAGQLLGISARWRMNKGDIEGGLDDLFVLQRMGQSLNGRGLLIEQLVGVSIEAMAYSEFKNAFARYEIPAKSLAKAQERLESRVDDKRLPINMEAEKAFLYDMLQRGFTDDGNGNGRVILGGMPFVVTTWQRSVKDFALLDFPDRKEVTAQLDRYYETIAQLNAKTPRQLYNEGWDDNKWNQIGEECLLLEILQPALSKISKMGWRPRTDQRATVAVMAILRYEKITGGYPESLDKLVANGYLKKLPMDPFSDGPLVYRIIDDGFTLYSAGLNMIDDDGQYGMKKGKFKQWAENGDAVFWPVWKDEN
ncbi:MAG TPA: hypothetical protein ENH94_11885 [Phycisphaerales bacterium]|nr:hypothetical protein [Phycisphaerales bacterium]